MEASSRPNVIWIFGDQHRRQLLSRMGDPNVRTPNIDALGEYGVTFTRAVSNFPLSCPARGTLLTGRHAHGVIPGHNFGLPEGQQTLANVMATEGYRTAWFGKWHVEGKLRPCGPGGKDWVPMQRHPDTPIGQPHRECYELVPRTRRGGFDTWIGYENNNSPHDTLVHGHDETGAERDLHRLEGFETDTLTDYLIEYINRRGREQGAINPHPFFAVLSVQPPHDPYAAPEAFMRNYQPASMKMRPNVPPVDWVEERARRELAGACALVENLDWNVGRVRAALREAGLDKNTWILFFSDHGDMYGSHGLFHKTNPYEESVGIPLIIGGMKDSDGSPRRAMESQPIGLVDLAPTTLGLCGIKKPDWMQGFDYSAIKTSRPTAAERAAWPNASLLQLVVPTKHGDSTDRAWRGVVTRDGWKYVCFADTDWLMFDLNSDPYELANLAHNSLFAGKRSELRQALRDLMASVGDSFPVPA